jgi:plasmid stabilization system protein ParE
MEVNLSPEAKAIIDEVTAATDCTPESVISLALESFLPPDSSDPHLASVIAGIEAEPDGPWIEVDDAYFERLKARVGAGERTVEAACLKLQISAAAEEDLFEILDRVSDADRPGALPLIARLEGEFRRIQRIPRVGRLVDSRNDLRFVPVGRWLVVYGSAGDVVAIRRIVHRVRELGILELSAS